MKKRIWSLDKFTRVLVAIFGSSDEDPAQRPAYKVAQLNQPPPQADLSQLLRNEKTVPSDRLPWSDIVHFREYYVYIHDMEEKFRPVMVREYKKPAKHEDGREPMGDWPHLNSVAEPKCPFLPDNSASKQDETEHDPQAPQEVTRAVRMEAPARKAHMTAQEALRKPFQPPFIARKAVDAEPTQEVARYMARHYEQPNSHQTAARAQHSTNTDSLPITNHFLKPLTHVATREPLASGLQRSNRTSGIESQRISSAALKPGAGRPVTKEMNELQRRAVMPANRAYGGGATSYHTTNDVRAAINQPASFPGKPAKLQRTTTLRRIDEIHGEYDDAVVNELSPKSRKALKKAEAENSRAKLKPGYCENCHDKYDSFAEVRTSFASMI